MMNDSNYITDKLYSNDKKQIYFKIDDLEKKIEDLKILIEKYNLTSKVDLLEKSFNERFIFLEQKINNQKIDVNELETHISQKIHLSIKKK